MPPPHQAALAEVVTSIAQNINNIGFDENNLYLATEITPKVYFFIIISLITTMLNQSCATDFIVLPFYNFILQSVAYIKITIPDIFSGYYDFHGYHQIT
jgi:hypothetical protein